MNILKITYKWSQCKDFILLVYQIKLFLFKNNITRTLCKFFSNKKGEGGIL